MLDSFRLEVDNDAIPGVAVDNVGVDVRVKLSDSKSNGSRDIRGADSVSRKEHDRGLSQYILRETGGSTIQH